MRFVGQPLGDQSLHGLDLLDEVARGGGFDAGRQDVEVLHDAVEVVGVALHDFHRFQLLQLRHAANFVLALVAVAHQVAHVGDVADVAHLEANMRQVPKQQVERHERADVAEVGVVIDRRPADVHTHVRRGEWFENILLAGEGVVYFKGHLLSGRLTVALRLRSE